MAEPARIQSAEAAAMLGVSVRTVQLRAAAGEIPGAALIFGRWTFDPVMLRRFIKRPAIWDMMAEAERTGFRMPGERGYVYFLQCGRHVKIGYSQNVKARVSAITYASPKPMLLLGYVRGCRMLERLIHERFAHQRSHGEWFRRAPKLNQFIAETLEHEGASDG